MNYAEMRDIDINKMVAMKVAEQRRRSGLPYGVNIPISSDESPMVRGFDKKSWDEVPGFSDRDKMQKFDIFKPKKKAEVSESPDYQMRIFDPCNSWADAGPIIEKHLICLAADVFAEPQDGGRWVAQPAYGWGSERVRSDNPLRAAMIVFLMMQESK